MWIVNKSNGDRVLLAKHFGSGWKVYTGPTELTPEQLFDRAEFQSEDFVIEYE
jgi:hypothetical protein